MQPLRKALRKVIREAGIEDGTVLLAVKRKWAELVGQTVAVHTCPDTIKNRILTIIVDTPQWMHHLSFFKGEITEKLSSYDIGEVRFRIGRLPAPEKERSKIKDASLSDDDLRFIDNTLMHVKDDELRRKFERLMTHGLSKGKE